jgi:hypothetical protein
MINTLAALIFCLADDSAAAALLTQAGAELKPAGGKTVTSVFVKDSSALTADHYRAIGSLQSLKTLTMYNKSTLTDETLALLAPLQALEEFAVDGAKISDDGMKSFAAMKSLKNLTFFHNLYKDKFTGAGLLHLKDLAKFDSFSCGGSTFTDEGFAAAAQLNLREIRIWHTGATDAGVAKLEKSTTLKILHLGPQFTPKITDASVVSACTIKSLETLSVMETRLSWAKSLSHVTELPALKLLQLRQDEISDEDLARLKQVLPSSVKLDYAAPSDQQMESLRRNFDARK